MNRLLLNIGIAFLGLTAYAQQSTTQVVVPPSNVDLQDPYSVTLKPGFWAKPGSVFRAHIGYREFNMDCPIITKSDFRVAYISPDNYIPEAINNNLRLALSYDNAGNTSRIYYANANNSNAGTSYTFSKDAVESLIYVYPNPTHGNISVSWDDSVDDLIGSMVLGGVSGISIPLSITTENGKRMASVSFSGPAGTYGLKIWLTDGRDVSKTLLKY